MQGWPIYRDSIDIKSGQRVIMTTAEDGKAGSANEPCLPVSNPKFVEMCGPPAELWHGFHLGAACSRPITGARVLRAVQLTSEQDRHTMPVHRLPTEVMHAWGLLSTLCPMPRCEVGDSLFVGRYLVNGADMSSLYLEVGHTWLGLYAAATGSSSKNDRPCQAQCSCQHTAP